MESNSYAIGECVVFKTYESKIIDIAGCANNELLIVLASGDDVFCNAIDFIEILNKDNLRDIEVFLLRLMQEDLLNGSGIYTIESIAERLSKFLNGYTVLIVRSQKTGNKKEIHAIYKEVD